MWILRILSLPGALFLNDLNMRNVSTGFIGRGTGLLWFNLLMSMIGYGVEMPGLRLWNSRLLFNEFWSILSSGGSIKCSHHSVLSEFSISSWVKLYSKYSLFLILGWSFSIKVCIINNVTFVLVYQNKKTVNILNNKNIYSLQNSAKIKII